MRKSIAVLVPLFVAVVLVEQSSAAVARFHFFDTVRLRHTDVEGQTFAPVSGPSHFRATVSGGIVGAPHIDARAYLVDYGLGVFNPTAPRGDRHWLWNRVMVDGAHGSEFIRLDFNVPVRITAVKFAFAGPFDRFGLAVDGVPIDVPAIFGSDRIWALAPPKSFLGHVDFPLDRLPFGTTWDIIAPTRWDSWLLENVDVIPEPTTLLVWSSLCLGALGFRRVRQRLFG